MIRPRGLRAHAPADLLVTPTGLRVAGRRFPMSLGRGGRVADKREGDGGTPRGTWRITGLLYRADRMVRPTPWAVPIGPRDLWCDDPRNPAYNHFVRAPFTASHERLRRADRLYDLVLLTDWNWPKPDPGRGSAIFIHCWRGRGVPTAGCLALRRDHLAWIIQHVGIGTRVIVP